ncbi:hypothetical protein C2845_PM07G18620 [Panicum miliaceum]|uniref:B3 domain-containing protein n=1 Tax=Panicum miliaceum TaxID=4540 RepID=A0A3L6SPE6_PANMI|nr:hypothetical protein C2845_PM07G18620 [Panicum miliaceum]
MPPCFAGAKRPLEMVIYDPAAAASKRARQEEATTSTSSSADSAGEPLDVLDVKPINAVPPQLPPPPPPLAGREAPPCLRRHFLEALGLRADLPVHFIDEKFVTSTDLDPHQNRFRIPGEGVKRRLRAILTPRELDEANLLRDPTPRSRTRSRARLELDQPAPPPSEQRNVAAEGEQPPGGKKIKKPKKKGRVHGGLRVKLVDLHAGAKELLMSRWESSRGTIVKGGGYLDFVRRCSFKERDAVEVWAFVQRRVRLFGSVLCDDSLLHVLVVKKDQQPPRCCCCCCDPPPAPAANPSTELVMA